MTSFRFVQEWAQSYSELLGSETHSVGFVNKNLAGLFPRRGLIARLENFQTAEIAIPSNTTSYVANAVIIRKLPEAEFSGRDRPIWESFRYGFPGILRAACCTAPSQSSIRTDRSSSTAFRPAHS